MNSKYSEKYQQEGRPRGCLAISRETRKQNFVSPAHTETTTGKKPKNVAHQKVGVHRSKAARGRGCRVMF